VSVKVYKDRELVSHFQFSHNCRSVQYISVFIHISFEWMSDDAAAVKMRH